MTLPATLLACAAQAQTTDGKSWNRRTALAYLDGRMA
jgi:hypothetical protein